MIIIIIIIIMAIINFNAIIIAVTIIVSLLLNIILDYSHMIQLYYELITQYRFIEADHSIDWPAVSIFTITIIFPDSPSLVAPPATDYSIAPC